MNRREIGAEYEQKAVRYLESVGYRVLERNYRCRLGEIDIIAMQDGYLCFVEVKYRGSHGQGYPEEAVNHRKQQKIIQTAEVYMKKKKISFDTPCRFDVVAMEGGEIRLIQNAYTL